MATRSFKNVGTTASQVRASLPAAQVLPIGIKTPMSLTGNGNPYDMHTTIAAQIQDNFRNMILTNYGERIGLYDYGANLRAILSEFSTNEDLDTIIMQSIARSVEKFMPFVILDTFDMNFLNSDRDGQAKYQIIVNYSVPKIGASNQKIRIILEAMG